MPTKIDHILIGVRDLDQAIEDFRALGLTVEPGGTHLNGQSKNGLVAFHDGTYLELIAPVNPDELDEAWLARIGAGDGFIGFAVFTPDIECEEDHLRAHGLDVSPIADGGRIRPDGQETRWRTLRIKTPPNVELPFIISDLTARKIRVPEGEDAVHANGLTRVLGLTSVVRDIDETADYYGQLFHSPGKDVTTAFHGAAKALRFPIGTQWLQLVEPSPGSELEIYLDRQGARPYEVVFAPAPSPSRGELQSTELSHGARLRFVTGRR